MGGGLAVWDLLFLCDGLRGEVNFTAEDGFHSGFLAGLVKFDSAEKIAVVGHRDGGHAELRGALGELIGADHTVKKREFRVQVEVDEGFGHAATRLRIVD